MRRNGFVLVASLIFLVIMTLLGLSMFHGFTTDKMMAGNLREKSRAVESAQTAINYAESWLANNSSTSPVSCSGMYSTPAICTNALLKSTSWPWTSGVNFSLPCAASTPSCISATGGVDTYAANPVYYIQYMGVNSSQATLFLITAAAVGGNTNAVAVLQTVYSVSQQTHSLGGS